MNLKQRRGGGRKEALIANTTPKPTHTWGRRPAEVQSECQNGQASGLWNMVVGARRVAGLQGVSQPAADLLRFSQSHQHLQGLQRMDSKREKSQWAAVAWRKMPC